jgi:hypothetical protein
MKRINIASIIRENKTLFIIIALGLFLLELEFFAVAAGKSGKTTLIKIFNQEENLVHEVRGSRLSDSDKIYVEKFFGPLKNLDIRLTSLVKPFPFRAWFAAAAGIPLAVLLLFVLFIKTYAALLYPDSKTSGKKEAAGEFNSESSFFDKVYSRIGRYNIYTIGFLIFLAVFAYWVVPNFIAFMGKLGIDTLIRFKWFFVCTASLFFGLGVWIIYLRYLLAKKGLNLQAENEKYRIALEYNQHPGTPKQIGYETKDVDSKFRTGEKTPPMEQ